MADNPNLKVLRRGSWVMIEGRLGILNTFLGEDAEIHYVDDVGDTEEVVVEKLARVKRVTDFDILPVKRRPTSVKE